MDRMAEIDFFCPFCKKEIIEDENILIGDKDNLDSFDNASKSPKVFFHVNCYKNSKKNE